MRQTSLCVPLEVKPESCDRLSELVDLLKQREDKRDDPATANFERLISLVPSLHFMSMSVFPAAEYDPLFILEANFDGPPGPFWAQLEPVMSDDLRAILRCCKRPLDGDGDLYDAVTQPGSRTLVAPYLEARTQFPSVFHHGNRGLTRDRILGDYALFKDVRDELDRPPSPEATPYHSLAPAALHTALRTAMLPRHDWLNEQPPVRISTAESLADWGRAIVFVLVALMALTSPGLLLAALVPWSVDLGLMILVALVFSALIYLNRHGLEGKEVKTSFNAITFLLGQYVKLIIVAAIYVIGASLVLDAVVSPASRVLHVFGIGPALASRPRSGR